MRGSWVQTRRVSGVERRQPATSSLPSKVARQVASPQNSALCDCLPSQASIEHIAWRERSLQIPGLVFGYA